MDFNFLTHEEDWVSSRAVIRNAVDVLEQKALRPYRGRQISPGVNFTDEKAVDEFIVRHGETGYHYVGTCRMGNGPESVVDGQLRVRGVDRLRFVDASVIPTIPNGNTNAPTIMVAEKASDMIRGRQ